MKTSEARNNNDTCPECEGRIAQDHKGIGHSRHLERKPDGELCTYGKGEKDT